MMGDSPERQNYINCKIFANVYFSAFDSVEVCNVLTFLLS